MDKVIKTKLKHGSLSFEVNGEMKHFTKKDGYIEVPENVYKKNMDKFESQIIENVIVDKEAIKKAVDEAVEKVKDDHKKQIVKLSENMVSKKDHDAIVEQLTEFKENSISKLDHDDLVKEAVDEAVEGLFTKKDLEAAVKSAKK